MLLHNMQIAIVSRFGVETGWLVCTATDSQLLGRQDTRNKAFAAGINALLGGPTNLSCDCLWRHSVPYDTASSAIL